MCCIWCLSLQSSSESLLFLKIGALECQACPVVCMLPHSLDLPHVLAISFMGSDSDILRRALHRYILCHTRRLRCYTCLSPQKGWVSEDQVLTLLCCQPYDKSSLSFDTGVCGGPGKLPRGKLFCKIKSWVWGMSFSPRQFVETFKDSSL